MKKRFAVALVLGTAVLLQAAVALAADAEAGFTPIFNGKDLTGWGGVPELWSVQDGNITGQTSKEHPAKENTFLVWTNGAPDDFELRCSFRLAPDDAAGFANSGIQYRSRIVKPEYWVVAGYQADMEAGPHYTGQVYEEKGRGILAMRGDRVIISPEGKINVTGHVGNSAELEASISKVDWNTYDIIAQGNHIIQKINDRVMVEMTDEQESKAAKSGIIALQLHAGPSMIVQFKDLRLKSLHAEAKKKIVLVAGMPSHGPGEHEYNAGMLLLKKCLDKVAGIDAVAYTNGWPAETNAFDGADAVVLYMDGGSGHPAIQGNHLDQLNEAMKRGAGLACLHYAVEVPSNKGGFEFLNWIGGYFETNWSVNPVWVADFKTLPDHPITRGVHPFALHDEWYYNMRFQDENMTPILTAIPPDSTREHPDDPHSGNPVVRAHKGQAETVAWAYERPDGGRGFGFTGLHFHENWANDNFRKIILNGVLWIAKADVPAGGVPSSITEADLYQNLDPKPGSKPVFNLAPAKIDPILR